jgi:RHS repeat-associated protein
VRLLPHSYLYDGKGNVTALLDGSQAVAATYTYDPFGNLMSQMGSLSQPFKFLTKMYDEQTGLSHFGYRFYSPVLGRWITRDAIGYAGGLNLYGFVGNNPVIRIDPLGLLTSVTGYSSGPAKLNPADAIPIQNAQYQVLMDSGSSASYMLYGREDPALSSDPEVTNARNFIGTIINAFGLGGMVTALPGKYTALLGTAIDVGVIAFNWAWSGNHPLQETFYYFNYRQYLV